MSSFNGVNIQRAMVSLILFYICMESESIQKLVATTYHFFQQPFYISKMKLHNRPEKPRDPFSSSVDFSF